MSDGERKDSRLLMGVTVQVDIDLTNLHRETDSRLAMLWHVAQANPAPHGDKTAGEVVSKITYEILRRWLAGTELELYHHQPRDHYWSNLGKFAKWNGQEWVARDEPEGDPS